MARKIRESLDVAMELTNLKIDLINLVAPHISTDKHYISYLSMYGEELEALVGLPPYIQRKELEAIAHKVLSSYQRAHNGGR